MSKHINVIVRQEDGTLLFNCILPDTAFIAVIEETIDEGDWKHEKMIFNNLSNQKKSKMLEHPTSQNNVDIL